MKTKGRTLIDVARDFHKNLPDRVREYLNRRGIPDELIDGHLLGWNGWRITIPIFNRDGDLAFFKQVKDPEDKSDSPKMIAWPRVRMELYGWEHLKSEPSQIIICEGEFDRLVLEVNGFKAVTSTGGAGAFRREWAKEFEDIPEVYICFDNDEAGRKGALRVGRMIPHAKIVELPEEVGEGGDITDLFTRLGKSREDFLKLMAEAKSAPAKPEPEVPQYRPRANSSAPLLSQRIERVKSLNLIYDVVRQYVQLRPSGSNLVGLCPFHEDHIPSFTVYPVNGTFHCYGCGKHGDVISFVGEIEHMNFGQVLDALDRFASQHESESK